MAKQANAGELRTRIYIRRLEKKADGEGVAEERAESVFDPGADGKERVWHCKWVNAYGTEAVTAMQLQIREPATLTMRYSDKIQADCLIYRLGDPEPYEIIGINDVEERHTWLEVRVCRKQAAQ